MYNATALQTAFRGLVGFFQPFDPEYKNLPASLTTSASGRFVQMVHPLCNLENIYNIAPEFDKFEYNAWVAGSFEERAIVEHEGKQWIATEALIAADVPGASGKWVPFNGLADYLGKIVDSSILEVFSDFVKYKKLEHSNRTLVDSLILFDGIGSFTDKIIKRGRFVGFQIDVSSQEGLSAMISKIGLQVDTAQTVDIYLYHGSVEEPLLTVPLEVAKASTFNFKPVSDAILGFSDSHDSGGSFYLGYYEDDLEGQAIKRDYDFVRGACLSCNEYNYRAFNTWSKHVKIHPIYVEAANLNGTNLFNTARVVSSPGHNYGLNLQLSVSCDMTPFFSQHKLHFADALAQKIALKILQQTAYTTRINVVPDKTRALAMADLATSDEDSFASQYQKELKALAVDFSGLNSQCMPMIANRGVRIGAI